MFNLALVVWSSSLTPIAEPVYFEGLGSHTRTITTQSQMAQRSFNQGLNFLFAFNHDEAIRSFQSAVEADPKCAMAWWGVAMANGPHINNPMVDEEHAKAAWNAIQKAKELVAKGTKVERSLVIATSKRYAMPQPADRRSLDVAFANAMRQVWLENKSDADVGAIFAESMMDLRPWDLWLPNGTPQPGTNEIVSTLRFVLGLNPKHPLANHLFIHALEASPHPEQAETAANTLRNLQPGLGHMVHMPSHIDVRTGKWREAILANQKAILADTKYRALSPQQGFYSVYMAHNRHMLAFAAMMIGRSKIAVAAMDEMVAKFPPEFLEYAAPLVDGYLAMPIEVRIRFGMWDAVLEAPEFPEKLPLSRALRHAARSIAFSAKGDTNNARIEQALFYERKKAVPENYTFGNNSASSVLLTALHLMNGELLIAENKLEKARAELIKAVETEDQLRYDEPPDWIQPTRHTLGALLLKMGRNKEAVSVYIQDLKKLPENGWSLYGISVAYDRLGQANLAAKYKSRFQTSWNGADMKIDSSCLCIPNKR